MAPMKLGQLGMAGMYRFTDAKSEAQYRQRLAQWCFWPAVVHLAATFAMDTIGVASYLVANPNHPPVYVWWLLAVDVVALGLLAAFRFSAVCQRHITPLFCVFICMEMAQYAAFIRFNTTMWTEASFSYIVPASAAVYVDGPAGRVDVSGRLRAHFAELSAYRAAQVAFSSALSCWVFNAILGLHWWSVVTNFCIPTSLAVGVLTSPVIPAGTPASYVMIGFVTSALCLLFSAAFERIQRRNFEAECLLHWELQASQMADSVLNHSLKNTLADVAGNIEMFLAGSLPTKALEDCIVSLRRGMRSCKERQVYLQLVAGQYQPVLNAINLQDFGSQLLAGRNAAGQFPDCAVYADHMLLTLIFDNALSNAAKHGDPQNPDITFSIEEISADVCPDLPAGKRRFCFQVTNVAHPGRPPLTPQYVAQLFAGKAGQSPEHSRGVPTLSDRIGLTHCVMAAKLAGIALSLSQEDDVVTFSGRLDAEMPEAPAMRPPPAATTTPLAPPTPPAFPPGLQYVVLDDSLPAQRLLRFHLEQWCAPSSVVSLGANAADVDAFMATSLLADVVIVDQNLVWGCEEVLGSNLVHQLRRLRYAGFICIRSADDGPNDQALYRQAGANCSVGKDVLGHVMIR
eukprot:EG_transcript_6702